MSASRFTHPPGAVLGAAALLAAAAATVLAGSRSSVALAVGVIGLVGVAAGLLRNTHRLSAYGSLAVLAAVVIAGAAAASPEVLLPAAAAALLSWDFGTGSFAAREELSGGRVERAELVQVVASIGVGAVAIGAAYGIYEVLSVGVSFFGVLLLLVAAAALGLALRE